MMALSSVRKFKFTRKSSAIIDMANGIRRGYFNPHKKNLFTGYQVEAK